MFELDLLFDLSALNNDGRALESQLSGIPVRQLLTLEQQAGTKRVDRCHSLAHVAVVGVRCDVFQSLQHCLKCHAPRSNKRSCVPDIDWVVGSEPMFGLFSVFVLRNGLKEFQMSLLLVVQLEQVRWQEAIAQCKRLNLDEGKPRDPSWVLLVSGDLLFTRQARAR